MTTKINNDNDKTQYNDIDSKWLQCHITQGNTNVCKKMLKIE